MKVENYKPTKSSFLSIEKDMSIIIDSIFSNKTLLKLLYYASKDALERPALTEEQKLEMVDKNIKIRPKVYVDNDVKT